jgi:multiple sugar transport system substrate-binding protein
MVRRTRRYVAALAVGVLSSALAACGSGGGGQAPAEEFSAEASGSMRVYAWNAQDGVAEARQAYAESQLAGVSVQYDTANFDPQKFTALAASGNLPDVVRMDRQYVGTYAAKDLIRPLDDCYRMNGVDPSAYFYPAVVEDVTYGDAVYAVPEFFQPPAILLNTRVTEAAGVAPEQFDTSNPEALVAAAEQLTTTAPGGELDVLGLHPTTDVSMASWLLVTGGTVMDDEGRPTLEDPGVVEAFEMLKALYDAQGGYSKVIDYANSFDQFGDENQYVTDQVAAQVYQQWYPNVLTAVADEVQIQAVPLRDAEGAPIAATNGTSFVIPTAAKNPSAACKWALAVTAEEAWMSAAEARAQTVAAEPGRMFTGLFTGSQVADQKIKEKYVVPTGNADFDQVIEAYYEVVGNGVSIGSSPVGLEIQRELHNALVVVGNGQMSVPEALARAQEAAMRSFEAVEG